MAGAKAEETHQGEEEGSFAQRKKMSNWRDGEIRELLSAGAHAKIIRQTQGRDSVVLDVL